MNELFDGESEEASVEDISDYLVAGPDGDLQIRTFTPTLDTQLPILVWFHGGGWVTGGIESSEPLLRTLANQVPCLVITVDYRLAPEHPFPAALDDAFTAIEWTTEYGRSIGGDPERIAVGGDSAGGNLAAAVALLARERRSVSISHQSLLYPVLNHSFNTTSYEENSEGYGLTKKDMKWFWEQYLPHEIAGHNQFAAPLRARNLENLPPATIVTAGFDPLRDEGIAYAERLDRADVPVKHVNFEGMVHGFVGMEFDRSVEARTIVIDNLETAFSV
ncbi:alpha/beta hydrolase [Halovenus marina]|uniref:alpha/beta hydrolase n=1 Tax=Halovenus marina TaxID=3396621 RepID=UPI003F55EBCD